GARFYDPQLVQFVSQDPVREYVQAYAYVGWSPVRYTDPTGMFFGLGGDIGGQFSTAGVTMPLEWSFDYFLETRFGTIPGLGGGGFFSAVANAGGLSNFLTALVWTAIAPAVVAAALASAATSAAVGGVVGAAVAGSTGGDVVGGFSQAAAGIFNGEFNDLGGLFYGTVSGITRGAVQLAWGMATLNPALVKFGSYDTGTVVVPRLSNAGGLNWPGRTGDTGPIQSSGTKPNEAAISHDIEVGRDGFLVSPPYFRFVANMWAGPGVEPGLYGQAYRLAGTVGFGVPGSLLWLVGQ
ncbi:hypothetical protein L6Q96_05785, partial [Candidatus Binatia bacterium]|nr:hypothetical protein [Candidatus Binatia bacterium]